VLFLHAVAATGRPSADSEKGNSVSSRRSAAAEQWEVLVRGRPRVGEVLTVDADGTWQLQVVDELGEGRWLVASASSEPVVELLECHGRAPLPPDCRQTSRFSTRPLAMLCSLRCARRRVSARYRSRGPRAPSRRPRPRWSRQQMQHPNWRQSTVRMRRRSPARARLTSTIWWLVPSACWKRTKLRSPPRTVAVATCWWTSIRISMRPNTVWCVCWPPRVLQRICARLAIPIRRSTVFATPTPRSWTRPSTASSRVSGGRLRDAGPLVAQPAAAGRAVVAAVRGRVRSPRHSTRARAARGRAYAGALRC